MPRKRVTAADLDAVAKSRERNLVVSPISEKAGARRWNLEQGYPKKRVWGHPEMGGDRFIVPSDTSGPRVRSGSAFHGVERTTIDDKPIARERKFNPVPGGDTFIESAAGIIERIRSGKRKSAR